MGLMSLSLIPYIFRVIIKDIQNAHFVRIARIRVTVFAKKKNKFFKYKDDLIMCFYVMHLMCVLTKFFFLEFEN